MPSSDSAARSTALRVLHIGKFFPPHVGGMETYLADLIQQQRSSGMEAFALVHGKPAPQDPEWLVRVAVQAQFIYAPFALGFPAALFRALHRFQPEVLHLHMPNNSVFWSLLVPFAGSLPWVVHWHSDVLVSSQRRGLLAWAYKLYRPFESAVLERAERIVVTSPPYLQHSAALAPWRNKCTVIPLGLPSVKFAPSEKEPDHWTPGRFRLLSIGRLAHYKGFETLIRAMRQLPHAELLIVGDGEERASLEALLKELPPTEHLPQVRMLGRVTDATKHALLQSCDLFCLASRERTEAFGMVLLEAMAHAKPCAVSALEGSGMPWIVQVAGCGVTVPVDDVQAWAQTILRLQNEPEQLAHMGAAGCAALAERFGIARNADQLMTLYQQICGEPLRATRDRLLIVIPAKDEAQTIAGIVLELRSAGWSDVVVVDDHSTDGTGAIAREKGALVIRPTLPVGAWGGMQTGIRYALRHGYNGVVTMDADGQHEVAQITKLLAERGQFDMVIGAFPERASRLRRLAWGWFRQLAGFDLRDLTSGFRLYSLDAMKLMASSDGTMLDYQDLGALLLAHRAGLRVTEVAVAMTARAVGASRIFRSWFSVARYMAITTVLCISRRPRVVRLDNCFPPPSLH